MSPLRKKYVLRLEVKWEGMDDVEAKEVSLRFRAAVSTALAAVAYKATSMLRTIGLSIDWKLQEVQNGRPPRGVAQGQIRDGKPVIEEVSLATNG